tara:strand:- start:80 stop:2086 length:2007 start_codon:yes stop_codon:yes gene_type:complete
MACDPSIWEDDTKVGEQIDCLRGMIADLKGDMNDLSSSASDFSDNLKSTVNPLQTMYKYIGDSMGRMRKFTTDTKEQYILAEQMAKVYKETSINIGLSVGRSEGLKKQFKGAMVAVTEYGGELQDVQQIYENFASSSGRVRILGKDEVTNIFKLGEAAGLFGDKASSLYETMDLMGVSNVKATARMQELIIESQEIALNSSKVVDVLADNMKSMQSYSFKGGVKGMTEMAKQAVKMRIDVSDVLGMADKFYQPEAAIEAAANLQMLGGDIAEAFGDPFETMYLARNKPEELAKRLQDMTENMMTFNQETGEYEFPAEVRMQLKAAGDQLGIDVGKMTEMARQTSKMKDVKMKLNMEGNITDDKMVEGISNLARMEGGKFVVDIYDKDGNSIPTAIEDLTKAQAKKALQVPKDEKDMMKQTFDYQQQMLYNSQTTGERVKNIEESFKYGFLEDIDIYKQVEEMTTLQIEALRETATKGLGTIKMEFDQTAMGEQLLEWTEMGEDFDQMMADNIKSIGELLFDKPIDITNPDLVDIDVAGGTISFGGKDNITGKDGNVNPTGAKKMWEGGEVPPGFDNDTYPAMLSSGEKVIPDAIPLSSLKDSSSKTEHKVGGTITLNINGADVPQELKNKYTEAWMNKIVQQSMAGNGPENGGTSKGGIDTFMDIQLT